MKKIIILFLMFSAIVFAEWSYSIHHNDYGVMFNDFTVYDYETASQLTVGITLDIGLGYCGIHIFNDKIKIRNNYALYIETSDDYVKYNVFKKDIENKVIRIQNLDEYNRGDRLIKMLISAEMLELYNNDTGKLLATFDLEGLKEIIEQKLGNSDWYKHKLND